MYKSDLKTGMRVEFFNGGKGIVFKGFDGGDFIVYSKNSYDNINAIGSMWRDDLTCTSSHGNKTIVRIYNPPTVRLIMDEDEKGELLWERGEKTAITLDGVDYSESTLRSLIKKATKS